MIPHIQPSGEDVSFNSSGKTSGLAHKDGAHLNPDFYLTILSPERREGEGGSYKTIFPKQIK